MSSILKALRKLENEKSELGAGSVDLARDILKRSYAERRSSSVWMIVTLVTALLMSVAGWWFFVTEPTSQHAINLLEQPLAVVTQAMSVPSKMQPQPLQPVVIMPNRPLAQAVLMRSEPHLEQVAVKEIMITSSVADAKPLLIPELTIDEIVFAADPRVRLAVVNDLPVMQGTDIAGVRVIEILADRVRFEFQGFRFDKFRTSGD